MNILSSREAFDYLRKLLTADVEELWVTALRADRSVIRSRCIFRGTVDSCYAHPRDIFRFACVENSSALIIAHNHPSEDPRPSTADTKFTKQLIRASRIVEIPVLDHLIVTKKAYWSFAENREFQASENFE